ncbi:beta-1,6-N-acetylglucosaminyltransferase [Paramaledivibacter caminithermalis]|uniref:Peptide O-xylosyltransferase n=1 Tax=Paramaledivibacter caminithermalis (strain DSM 15212 / CIP 107654 / DViRD3) TaxID=1121301 RepID=A0A1M6JUA4_PARC5|nr:beta-1,6-N-acetylglucosaminyltransferase [Paramaledivibacter caminithermalis]SHJ50277.1 Core-2/I-Branching enzyme [Paramaledivibacter caminithermalis DSM 15212]
MEFVLDYDVKTCDKKLNNLKKKNNIKVAFLILAHKNPSQIVDFINALDCEQTAFFIHIDKKSNIIDDSCLNQIKDKKNVIFTQKRERITWGGYGDVAATLLLLEEALERDEFDYISLHSGQDLPISNKYEILEFLKQNQGREFIKFFSHKIQGWWPPKPMDRINYYWFIEELGLEKSWKIYEMQKKAKDKRKFLKDIKPFAGWQWWTITKECGEYIIDYVDKNESYCDFYKYTLLPDEGFFQTIILNSYLKHRVVNDNLRYTEGKSGEMHPHILTKKCFNKIINSNKLFARKFDINVDKEIIEMILNRIM